MFVLFVVFHLIGSVRPWRMRNAALFPCNSLLEQHSTRNAPHEQRCVLSAVFQTNGVSAMVAELPTSSASPVLAPTQQQQVDSNRRALPELPEDALHISSTLTLFDRRCVQVRAIQPDDSRRLCAFHARLSPETIYLRYCGARPSLLSDEEAQRLAHVDYACRMAVVATIRSAAEGDVQVGDEQIIAIVEYVTIAPATAEVAFLVADRWQGQGIGTHLLCVLAAYARRQGIGTFVATVLPRNVRMLGVFHHCGFPYAQYRHGNTGCTGSVEIHLDLCGPLSRDNQS